MLYSYYDKKSIFYKKKSLFMTRECHEEGKDTLIIYQLFSGRSLRTVTAVCHISLSRKAFNSASSFSR